ncbi:hypothetical protein C1646_809278 [Rhizophagus diaphanus]|nr:hypothetical protein C1646_809278 [Rhizophagus diaphanus] [Rhizophagus sp. MUCL 43196]
MTNNNNNITFSPFISIPTIPTNPSLNTTFPSSSSSSDIFLSTNTTTTTTIKPSPLESLTITSLSTLESLIESSGELFNSLLEYSSSPLINKGNIGDNNNNNNNNEEEEKKRQKVILCYEIYKNHEKELKENIDNVKIESSTSNNNRSVINELIKTRDSLLQESDTQKTHLTNLLEQTYKLQFQIQTLLACSEQQHVILPTQPEQQQQQQQQQEGGEGGGGEEIEMKIEP